MLLGRVSTHRGRSNHDEGGHASMDAITTLVLSIGNLFGFYALLALGLGFIFGQLRVVNVAHGDFVMVGAYVMFSLGTLPFVVRVLVAALVAITLGLIAETTILRRRSS